MLCRLRFLHLLIFLSSMRMIHCLSKGRRIPGFVRMLSVSSWAPGDKVQIISTGELGTVAANLRGGWWSVDVNSTKKRLRTRDITTVHKALTTKLIDETPIKSNATAASILTTPPKVSKKIAVPIPIVAPPETVADDLDSEHALHYDLKTIEPPLPHTRVQNWIIFSDLHVKSASIEICEEVLTRVHEAAVERSAGVSKSITTTPPITHTNRFLQSSLVTSGMCVAH